MTLIEHKHLIRYLDIADAPVVNLLKFIDDKVRVPKPKLISPIIPIFYIVISKRGVDATEAALKWTSQAGVKRSEGGSLAAITHGMPVGGAIFVHGK